MPVCATTLDQVHALSALRYRLLDAPADFAPLRVLRQQSFDWRGWRVTCCVLGASHAVVLRRGDGCVTELLACCDDARIPEPRETMRGDRDGSMCASVHGLTVSTTVSLIGAEAGGGLIGAFASGSRLDVAFPAEAGPSPVTRIGWRTTDAALTVETVHTYPQESRGVRTQTVFTIAAGEHA